MKTALLLPLALTAALALSACGSDDASETAAPAATPSSGSSASATPGAVSDVAVAFYPLQFLAERIGGSAVDVTNLTAPGAEPHDLELKPRQVAQLGEDDLVLYLKGFQPAVDDAVSQQAAKAAFDVSTVTPLSPGYVPIEEGEAHEDEKGDDPHVWLDPLRFAAIGDAVAARLGQLQPAQAATFTANAAALRAQLEALDADYKKGLATCERREIVTSHNAFGYLAKTYGLEQVSLTGLTPEDEASPATLARLATFAKQKGVTTIFFEELVSPDVAKTLAQEVGAKAVDLSPIEGAPETGDYLTQMRTNLGVLQTALGCTTA